MVVKTASPITPTAIDRLLVADHRDTIDSADLGVCLEGQNMKKAKFHWEAAAMAGCEVARHNLGSIETNSGNMDQTIKHWIIAASGGQYRAMQELIEYFEKGSVTLGNLLIQL